ncbi:unnamed protein product, partial [Hapterophycus canaliculatus]
SVRFGAVPVPNLCVELRGYEASAAVEDAPSAAAAGTTAVGRAWRGWGQGQPRFLRLGRTGASDGSFTFVTPEVGMILVLAAYSHDGDRPAAVRVFPDDDGGSSVEQCTAALQGGGGGAGVGRGGAPAFCVGSGRVQVHIDLLAEGDVSSPEDLWSSATDLANDRSPCARRGTTGPLSHDGAAMDLLSPSSRMSGWLKQTSEHLRRWSEQRSSSLWNWISQRSTQLSNWFDRKSSLFSEGLGQHVPQFALWWREAWIWLSPHLHHPGPFELGASWYVLWVRVACIALLLGVLQQAFCFITRASSGATGLCRDNIAAVEDTPGCESPPQDPGTSVTDSMIATVHNADGTMSQLDFAELDRSGKPATIGRKRKGILASMLSGGRSDVAEEIQGRQGREEGTDEFSSMFRALSQPVCDVSAPTVGVAGGASNFVVLTQQSGAHEARA